MRRLFAVCPLLALLLAVAPAWAQEDELKSYGFGVALGFSWNVLSPDLVAEASIDANGIVRVDRRVNTTAGFMLESHYFPLHSDQWGTGPFVAVQPGTDKIISAAGIGWMIGWKRTDSDHAFGLGVGYAALPEAKVLGDEFKENQLAPLDPDGQPIPVRWQTRDKGSVIAVLSFVF